MKYARLVNNTVQEVIEVNPEEHFTSEVAAMFQPVPDSVEPGYTLEGGAWFAPVVVEPTPVEPVVAYPVLTPIEFKMCFTSAERIAGRTLAKTDPVMADAYEILDDPRLTQVDLNIQSNRDLLDYMTQVGIIAAGRKEEILAGKMK